MVSLENNANNEQQCGPFFHLLRCVRIYQTIITVGNPPEHRCYIHVHVFVRYCYAKQLIKAIQVQSENLEVVNCPQLQLSAKTSSVK
ncbi:hypothetical protein T4B_8541 [Trichinella pseudospiralis]|uniref:Uncharacterized protein n=1 Tax=Trichinella pseudospiralis TaxID=6337 RepID=A0A0V1E9J3_TRIPS|nr:hypothetical protein T4A_4412 [Trichinella pseudospiralis]KRZ21000.1 hypothetical protein T4B_8541 [Trichinella pseudospiralis]KRZ28010.1 hypothetical protein T4C_11387 [Trichinella pseudospiralis]